MSKNDVNKTLIHNLVHEHQIVVTGNGGRLKITPRCMAFVFSDWIDWNMKYSVFRAEYYPHKRLLLQVMMRSR